VQQTARSTGIGFQGSRALFVGIEQGRQASREEIIMPIATIVGALAEKLAEKHGEEAARWVLSELQKRAAPIAADLISTCVPDILGAQAGGQWVLFELQKHGGPIAADLAARWGPSFVGQGTEELLRGAILGLDELPGDVLGWASETRLAEIGRTSLDYLSAQARSRIKEAGYTSTQLGAAVIMHLSGVTTRIEDWVDGEGDTA
jgi:hypothetical protein